jgi:hypothetical protein
MKALSAVSASNLLFYRGHEVNGESIFPRFSINIYLPQLPLRILRETSFHLVAAMLRCDPSGKGDCRSRG